MSQGVYDLRIARQRPLRAGLTLTQQMMEDFLEDCEALGRKADTVRTYRRCLNRFYAFLPEDKYVDMADIYDFRQSLTDGGLSPRAANVHMAAVNSLLEFCGHRELQANGQLKNGDTVMPELSRNEYLRLLSTARVLERERLYLLIKLFGVMGLSVRDVSQVTVDAVEAGQIKAPGSEAARIPPCLREELLAYIGRQGYLTGPVFLGSNGKPMHRSVISAEIRRLCRDARVPVEKGNPRCLRRLCQETRAGIRENMELLIEQTYDRLLEKEQASIGWRETGGQ